MRANGYLRWMAVAGISISIIALSLIIHHAVTTSSYQVSGRAAMVRVDSLYLTRPLVIVRLDSLENRMGRIEREVRERAAVWSQQSRRAGSPRRTRRRNHRAFHLDAHAGPLARYNRGAR